MTPEVRFYILASLIIVVGTATLTLFTLAYRHFIRILKTTLKQEQKQEQGKEERA